MSRARLKAKDVDKIWRSFDEALVFDDLQNQRIVHTADLWDATTHAVKKQGRERLAEAHKVLTKWCAAHRQETEQFLGKRLAKHAFNPKILSLENALAEVGELVCTLPPRLKDWRLVAPQIWQEAENALEAKGRRAGTSANSVAVRFTSKVLIKIGYSEATPDAVRSVVEQFVRACNFSRV
jgi:hypothetical protein